MLQKQKSIAAMYIKESVAKPAETKKAIEPFRKQTGFDHPKELFIGNFKMRTGSAHENRFASVPTKAVKNQRQAHDFGKQAKRNIDFTLPVNCSNLYDVKERSQKNLVTLSKSLGRDNQNKKDCYIRTGQGAANETSFSG